MNADTLDEMIKVLIIIGIFLAHGIIVIIVQKIVNRSVGVKPKTKMFIHFDTILQMDRRDIWIELLPRISLDWSCYFGIQMGWLIFAISVYWEPVEGKDK